MSLELSLRTKAQVLLGACLFSVLLPALVGLSVLSDRLGEPVAPAWLIALPVAVAVLVWLLGG